MIRNKILKKRLKIVILAIILTIILLFLVREYIEFRFLVGEGLVLTSSIKPLFVLKKGDIANISVTVNTNNDIFCKSFCEYSLVNLEDNSIISNGSKMLSPGEPLKFSYAYLDKEKKEGQTLFVFEITCRNIKDLFCVRQTEPATLTNLIVVNYELSEEEKTLKEDVRKRLLLLLDNAIDLDFKSQEIKAKAQTLGIEYDESELLSYFKNLESIKELWEAKDYFSAKEKIDSIENVSLEEYSFILEDFDELNQTIQNLKKINKELKKIKKDSYSLRNNSIKNVFVDSIELYNMANGKALKDLNKSKDYILQINLTDLIGMYNDFESLIIDKVNESVESQYENLCSLNESLCNLSYYPESRTDFCLLVESFNESLINDILDLNQSFCFDIDYPRIKKNKEIVYMFVYEQRIFKNVSENLPECCVFGECKPCCVDCSDDPSTYPIIFIHGHAFNKESAPDYSLGNNFIALQNRLQEDGYINAGVLTPSASVGDVGFGEWGKSGRPITVRLTYYYNFYRGESGFVAVPQKNENIESYSIRLKEFIDLVKFRTGKKKVILVAHSMGGLVARSYVNLFGGSDVHKLILLATPNRGIDSHIASLCPVFGEEKECNDMREGSVFLNKLNSEKEEVNIYTITATGCEMSNGIGDGIVLEKNVPLDYATNFIVNGKCDGFLKNDLHSDILFPDKYPEVYEILRKILKES